MAALDDPLVAPFEEMVAHVLALENEVFEVASSSPNLCAANWNGESDVWGRA